jgi:uncharacterized protein (TIGR03437 family)
MPKRTNFTISAMLRRSAVVVSAFILAGAAQANILVNGSFESPTVTVGGSQNFNVGSAGIPGWTVMGPAGEAVAIVSGSFTQSGYTVPAQDGSQWMDLTGSSSNNIEGISQTAPTVSGKTYTLTFWVGNVSGSTFGTISSVGLKINGSLAGNYTNSTPGVRMNWQKFTYSFVATSNTSVIEFDNLDPPSDNSNGLDNVDLEEGGTASPAPVNLIVNGDFETPVVTNGSFQTFNSGSAGITGWTVIGTAPNTVAVVSGAYVDHGLVAVAEDGHQWLDLTGDGVSTGTRGVTQTVPTIAGMTYSLTFWVGNAYDPGGDLGTTSTVGLKINGTGAGNFTNSAQGTALNWQHFSTTFTATGNSTVIEFDNLDPSTDSSNGVDNVVLQAAALVAPSVSAGGVVSASAFGGFSSISPGSWVEIYGANLAGDTRGWAGSDFNGVNAPTSLDGTSVSIGGQAAFVDYISPVQVNALIPSTTPIGAQQITVKTAAGSSAPFTINVNPEEPGLLATPTFDISGTPYAVAFFADGTYVLPSGAIAGLSSRPAKPGDTIILYGVGFGPVTPNIPAGQLVGQGNMLATSFQISIGGMAAAAAYAGLAPTYTGLYQFNVTAPAVTPGNAPLTFNLGGTAGTQTLYIAVGN